MADKSHIEWTDATWNPVTGCSVVSPGCTNCYAMKLAGGRLRNHPSRKGLTVNTKTGPVWNGKMRFNEQWLTQPLEWAQPRKIFVCAHGDLFHESVPDEWIDKVFAVMALAPQHTFQVLTKRAKRMREYVTGARDRIIEKTADGSNVSVSTKTSYHSSTHIGGGLTWPLGNVWLGVSAEDQARADERIPELLATPAAMRFISAEPLLGRIDTSRINTCAPGYSTTMGANLDWVICGGESGPNARPMHPDWARSLRDQCTAAGVPFFFKQWGELLPHDQGGGSYDLSPNAKSTRVADAWTWRVGKHRAGRLLDGALHNAMPVRP